MTELFEEFQEFRKILCICPNCGEIVRVSDLKLKTKGPAAKTWLDEYQKKIMDFEKKEGKFEEKEAKIREKSVEKGRLEAEKAVKKLISPQLNALKIDPFDVKPILNPVDFVVFNGMTKKEEINDIIFLSKAIKNTQLNTLRQQVKKAVLQNKYEWQIARIDEKGNITFE